MPGLTGRHPFSLMLIGLTNKVTGLGLGCAVHVVFGEADDLNSGWRDVVLGDEFARAGVPERDACAIDYDAELGSGMALADAVDHIADTHSPVGADGAAVLPGRVCGAGAVDDVSDVLRPFGICAVGPTVADVLGARFRPGVFEKESAGVIVELYAFTLFSDVDGAPGKKNSPSASPVPRPFVSPSASPPWMANFARTRATSKPSS